MLTVVESHVLKIVGFALYNTVVRNFRNGKYKKTIFIILNVFLHFYILANLWTSLKITLNIPKTQKIRVGHYSILT